MMVTNRFIISMLFFCFFFSLCSIEATRLRSVRKKSNSNKNNRVEIPSQSRILKTYVDAHDIDFKEVHFIAETQMLVIEEKEYSLENLKPLQIFSPNILINTQSASSNLHDFHSDNLWSGYTNDNTHIIIAKDIVDRITYLEIFDGDSSTTFVEDGETGELKEYDEYEFLNEPLSSNFTDPDIETPPELGIPPYDPNNSSHIFMSQSGSCRVVDLSIATTAGFCSWAGGFNSAMNKIKIIAAAASNKFTQNGVCISLRLTAIDIRCNPSDDPYSHMGLSQSGCYGSGALNEFGNYWNAKMSYIPRDSAHLFHTVKMDGPLGCSSQADICRRNSYGVEYMSSYTDVNMQGTLLCHEVAHNVGASHFNGPGYIMNSYLTNGKDGWSSKNVYEMSSYMNSYGNCLH